MNVRMTVDRRVRVLGAVAVVGVVAYVCSWLLAGLWWDGYDPTTQAISELFATGSPDPGRLLLLVVLAVTGVALVAFAWGLRLALPSAGPAAAGAAGLSGVMTVAITAVPCTEGCPPFGTTTVDDLHSLTAGVGYLALVSAPLLAAPGLWRHHPRLATASWVLGGLAAMGFAARVAGVGPDLGGLYQRLFNTTADLWYVVVGIEMVRRGAADGATRSPT